MKDSDQTRAYNCATYGERIRKYRLKRGLTQPQLAAILQVNKNYVSNWEIGKARPDMNILPALCEALHISLGEFFGVLGELNYNGQQHMRDYMMLSSRDQRIVDNLTESLLAMKDSDMRQHCLGAFISIFHNDLAAAAGSLNYLDDTVDGEYEFIRRSPESERADEIITVTGDSMEPTYYAGDDLLIEHTATLEPGEIGIIIINGEGFVKEYRKNGVYSHNAQKYPFRKFLSTDEIRIVGRVLGKIRRQDRPSNEEAAVLDDLHRDGCI